MVLVCTDKRTTNFPFDVQHRTIIKYSTNTPSDFEKLRTNITRKINAYLQKARTLSTVSKITSLTTKLEGLDSHEVMMLATITANLEQLDEGVSVLQIKRDMEINGYTNVATSIALKSLSEKKYLEAATFYDFNGEYPGYKLTQIAWNWIMSIQDKFVLRQLAKSDDSDDEIPF